eukprot:1161467-Pelagomonas_calceolata.AAC.2
MERAEIPACWKVAKITPLYKKGSVLDPGNYHMLAQTYQRIVHGELKTGMKPPGKRHWRVKEEHQRTRKHTLAKERGVWGPGMAWHLCAGTTVHLRAVPQAYACGQQLHLVCRLQLCLEVSCWAWLSLVGRLTVLTLLVVEGLELQFLHFQTPGIPFTTYYWLTLKFSHGRNGDPHHFQAAPTHYPTNLTDNRNTWINKDHPLTSDKCIKKPHGNILRSKTCYQVQIVFHLCTLPIMWRNGQH